MMSSMRDNSESRRPDFSVVLVSWNSKTFLQDCLLTLYAAQIEHTFEVIIVDNNSTDGTPDVISAAFPQALVVRLASNSGFAAASNAGIREAAGRHVLLLNCDALIDGRSLDMMVSFLDRTPAAACVGGRLLNPDESFQSGYGNFSSLLEELAIALRIGSTLHPGYPLHRDSDSPCAVQWLSAACLLVRKAVFDEVGYLDEQYFMYSEEVDFQYRLRLAGWSVYYLPGAFTVHYGGGSQGRYRRRAMVYRGKLLFYAKHYGRLRSVTLRLLLGGISVAKSLAWTAGFLVKSSAGRAQNEIRSNIEVLRLCLKLN